jgi:hypothetical protein
VTRTRGLLGAAALLLSAGAVLAVLLLGGGRPSSARAANASATAALPPIRHVWVIMLENEDYASTFGDPTADPYLAKTLPRKGALLENYFGTGHNSNDNYVAFVSGQPPNPQNQSDCPIFDDFVGAGLGADGIESGTGCVYPSDVPNIGTQLTAAGLNWKAYEQDMGNDPTREPAACGHPAVGAVDKTQEAEEGDGYAARHDPFVYFHSVIDDGPYCDAHVVALGTTKGLMPFGALPGETGLATDLKSTATTPAFSFITPNLCNDGHDYPCKNQASGASALADIDSFLKTWVPKITNSPAYKKNGLIEVTFDESDGPQSDSSSCCGETPGPASPVPGITGPGGGLIGAVLLSPYIKKGTVTLTDYNHYSSLATFEDLFALPPLGEAQTVTSTFGSDVFTKAPHH